MRRSTSLAILAYALLALPASAQLLPRDGSTPIAVRSHRVEALVEDGLARTSVRQTFVNHHGRPLEALYTFPLPEGAALIDVAMEVGGQRLEGLLAERKRARKVYDDIVRTRRDPALVEQIGRNAFRLSVFPVMPDEETVVEISWIQPVPLAEGAYRYVYPLSLGGPAARTERDLSIAVTLRSSVPLAAVTASREDAEVLLRGPREAIVALEEVGAALNRDLVVTAEVASAEPDLSVKTFRDASGDGGWFLAVVTPPRARPDQLIPRDVILVLDTSGSMSSDGKIEQARRSALWLLEHLRPADRVNVLRFSSDVQAFAPAPVAASPENLEELAAFVRGFEARGSTALGDALWEATQLPEERGRVRTVVLLTDGRPTIGEQDPAALVGIAGEAGEKGLRVFPFGVGQDVDSGLLRGIASAGRGRAEIFRPGGEIATRLTAFLARTSSPVIADLALSVEGVEISDVLPRPLPDAHLGEQVTISGRYRGAGSGRVSVSGTIGGEKRSLSRSLAFPAGPGGSEAVSHLFARQKLDYLEEARRLRLGLADDAYYRALDRGAYSTAGEIVQEMVSVSLGHGVQCAYTSFIVLLPEDRHRIDPRDVVAVTDALRRAREEAGRDAGDAGEEPVLQSAEIAGSDESEEELDHGSTQGEPDFVSDSPFDSEVFTDVIGIGGGAGGKYGGRFGARSRLRGRGTASVAKGLADGLSWLARHQDEDGRWDAFRFMKHDPPAARCDGEGDERRDVGATGLALLAFLGDGNTSKTGGYCRNVARGIGWLKQQQDPDSGLLGKPLGDAYLYDHAIATLAVCEAYYFTRSPLIKRTTQKAVDYLVAARSPEGVWSCGSSLTGRSGTWVTGWVCLALVSAREGRLKVEEDALVDALAWVDGRTAAAAATASASPVDDACAIAMRLMGSILLGRYPVARSSMEARADLLLASLSGSSRVGGGFDPELWFFGSHALYQMGDPYWDPWSRVMEEAVLQSQRRDASFLGSWDAAGCAGGRVGSTALMVVCLESRFRYARMIHPR